ncbi:MAG TPA: hypothetical protein VMW36_08945 [Patescibacteria group bacterium]|nr:hypothetical protein [Patescibacteria group bacterium]
MVKKGKIAKVYELHQKGLSTKEISEKMKLKETIVRSYVWRSSNPQKYRDLLQRYFTKRKQKKENEEVKAAVDDQEKKEA